MKVVLIGSKDFDSLEYHINDSLTFLGHTVFHIDIKDIINIPYKFNYWSIKFFSEYDNFIFKSISKKVIEQHPDLVIATYRFIHPNCIKEIKRELKNTPVIHVNPDALTTFEHQQVFASPYDFFFTKDPYIERFMKAKLGLNAHYLPEAFNIRTHKCPNRNREEVEKEINSDVSVFGTLYPYRARIINKIIEAGINVSIYGTKEKRYPELNIVRNFKNEYIRGERKSEIVYGSKIVFNNFHYAEIESANVKFFEINGIGGFQICDYKPILKEYSKVDVKKFTFSTIDEAIDLIKYYLNNEDERHLIADAQMEYFKANHTYEHRINKILSMI